MADESGSVIPFPETSGFSRTGFGAAGGTSVAVDIGDLAVQIVPDGQGGSVVEVTAPAVHTHDDDDTGFSGNLAVPGGPAESLLAAIADEVIQGVEADEQTRAGLIADYNSGLDLLGQRLEEVSANQGTAKNISKIGHPLLIEAMVKYHAGALAEMMPAQGPAKVSTTGKVSADEEERAQTFSDLLNYYLTEIANEYYPDTSQALMQQGYCGNVYKKIYRCPIRLRPVSEYVKMPDLIVSEEATSLDNALRVTHRFFPSRAEVKRMQILGMYRDFKIPYASAPPPSSASAIKRSEGLAPQAMRPQDMPLMLYECDLLLDPEFFAVDGKYERDAPEGLPLPYKVTVDVASRQVLGIWRNWEEGDELFLKNNMFVHYGLVPGLGFHHMGFLQLLGNQTRALRAIWRLLIDSGMFGIFPGGIKSSNARTSTNEIAPGPGEWVDVDIPSGTDIRTVLMALPYKQLDAVFVQFQEAIQQSATRLGGLVELEVGEGRTNAPVGTVMSQIEQSTQIMAAVHKSNHRAQKQELMKLRKLFVQNPSDLWRLNPNPAARWESAEAFKDLNLLPASDPNIPAQVHRLMQTWALLTLAQQVPGQFDIQEVLRRALTAIRIADPKTLLLTPEQQAAAAQAAAAGMQQPMDPSKMVAAQAKIQQAQLQHQGKMQELSLDHQHKQADLQVKAHGAALESADRAADRQAQIAEMQLKMQLEREKAQAQHARDTMQMQHQAVLREQQTRQQMALNQQKQQHDMSMGHQQMALTQQKTQHDMALGAQKMQQAAMRPQAPPQQPNRNEGLGAGPTGGTAENQP